MVGCIIFISNFSGGKATITFVFILKFPFIYFEYYDIV